MPYESIVVMLESTDKHQLRKEVGLYGWVNGPLVIRRKSKISNKNGQDLKIYFRQDVKH